MEDKNYFENCPEKLYEGIFKYLELNDLKSCNKVCFEWYSYLNYSKTFTKTGITVWNGDQMSIWQYLRNIFQLRRRYIIGQEFRLRRFDTMQILKLTAFIRNGTFKNITHLEIVNSDFGLYMLQRLITKFRSLISLTLSNLFLTNTGLNPTANYMTRIRANFHKIKILKFHFKELFEYEKFKKTITWIGEYFNQLEHFSLNMFGNEECWKSRFYIPYTDIHSAVAKIVQNNARTLKEVSLNFNIVQDSKANTALLIVDESKGFDNNKSFISFLDQLAKYSDWVESGLQLKKLYLGFGFVRIDNPKSQQIFLPFLKTQTALQKFSFDQLFIPTKLGLENLLACVPSHCQCSIRTINLPKPVFPPEENANPLPQENSDSEIDFEYGSQVILKTCNIHLTLSLVIYKSIENINFLTRNIRNLTKVNIKQLGCTPSNKIIIIDKDIQNIIGNAIHLTELCLKNCNMNSVTDFGLTGIGPDACNRMSATNNFELIDGDITGLAISNLNNLRSLMLHKVGNGVTDITAHHAFNGLEKLNSFAMFSPNMSRDGFRMLKQLFQCNQVIKTQYLFFFSDLL